MNICTVCDNKYIHKGLALYQSLRNTLHENFTLHWLCGDDIIYKRLERLSLSGVILYNLPDLEDQHPELRKAKNNPKSNYGNEYSQYVWTLTPWFINHLLAHVKLENVLYADSDIFFYQSPKIIAETVGNKAVGIHTHRFSGTEQEFTGENGWYNVGVMYFNNTPAGLNISTNWKNWLLEGPAGPYYKTHGTCGDQKFLELFKPLFGEENVCVFDQAPPFPEYAGQIKRPYKGICHQAPWCTDSCGDNPVLFYHFSHFVFDLSKGTWEDHIETPMEWNPSATPGIRPLYENYFQEMKNAESVLNSSVVANPFVIGDTDPGSYDFKIDIIGNIKIDESKPERIKMLLASIRSLAFLKNNCRFVLLLEGASSTLQTRVRKELVSCGFNYMLLGAGFGDYGKSYTALLKTCSAPYVLNFLEDHFCTLDKLSAVSSFIETMQKLKVDVLKTSFWQVEQKSIATVEPFYKDEKATFIFDNTIVNHRLYQKEYGQRYYISVHFLATREFALRMFADRNLGHRPHEYEILNYTAGWEHRAMVPGVEFLASIDDDHGEDGTKLLDRFNTGSEQKFWDIYNTI